MFDARDAARIGIGSGERDGSLFVLPEGRAVAEGSDGDGEVEGWGAAWMPRELDSTRARRAAAGSRCFGEGERRAAAECARAAAPIVWRARALEEERRLREHTQRLLNVAQNIFRKLDDLTVLLQEIMQEARNLTNAEKCAPCLLPSLVTSYMQSKGPPCTLHAQVLRVPLRP